MEADFWSQLMDMILSGNTEAIGPFLSAFVVAFVWQKVKKARTWIEGMNPWLHRGVVAVLAVAVSFVGQYVDAAIPSDIGLWDQTTISSFVTAGWAMLLHQFHKERSGGTSG